MNCGDILVLDRDAIVYMIAINLSESDVDMTLIETLWFHDDHQSKHYKDCMDGWVKQLEQLEDKRFIDGIRSQGVYPVECKYDPDEHSGMFIEDKKPKPCGPDVFKKRRRF